MWTPSIGLFYNFHHWLHIEIEFWFLEAKPITQNRKLLEWLKWLCSFESIEIQVLGFTLINLISNYESGPLIDTMFWLFISRTNWRKHL